MLETKYVRDNFEMLKTILADFVTNIFYLLALASGTNIKKISPISKNCHQHPNIYVAICIACNSYIDVGDKFAMLVTVLLKMSHL